MCDGADFYVKKLVLFGDNQNLKFPSETSQWNPKPWTLTFHLLSDWKHIQSAVVNRNILLSDV